MVLFQQPLTSFSNPSINRVNWTPNDLTNKFAWYDFSDLSTITKDGSNRVSEVTNKFGGTSITQAIGAEQPLWVEADQNGLDVIDFQAGDHLDNETDGAGATPNTISGVLLFPADNGVRQMAWNGLGLNNRFFFENQGPGTGSILAWFGGSSLTLTDSSYDDTWIAFNFIYHSTASFSINGSEVKTGNSGTQSWTGIRLGIDFNEVIDWESKIGEIIIQNGASTAQEKIDIYNYLSAKWGTP